MLLSQTNIDRMHHHNMLSITAFSLLKSLSENQRFMPKNWLSVYVCQPWPVICIQTEFPHTFDIAKQVITGPQTYFSNVHNLFVDDCVSESESGCQACPRPQAEELWRDQPQALIRKKFLEDSKVPGGLCCLIRIFMWSDERACNSDCKPQEIVKHWAHPVYLAW